MSEHEHNDLDLVVRARLGLLSPGDEETLRRAFQRSPELETAYRVGVEFDRLGVVQRGDDALIARAAGHSLSRVADMSARSHAATAGTAIGRKKRWTALVALGLGMTCASGVAAAFATGALPWPFQSSSSPAEDANQKPPEAAQGPVPRSLRAQAESMPKEVPSEESEQSVTESSEQPRAAAPNPVVRKPAAPSAAELFRDANSARRGGDLARARRLYAQLIAVHPSSDEAGLARVSLGRLLLAAGDARGAERELRSYLSTGGGQLSEEALVGQAQSLGRLGRLSEERAAWQRLLSAYPESVYAAQAKQRLAQLDESAPKATPPVSSAEAKGERAP